MCSFLPSIFGLHFSYYLFLWHLTFLLSTPKGILTFIHKDCETSLILESHFHFLSYFHSLKALPNSIIIHTFRSTRCYNTSIEIRMNSLFLVRSRISFLFLPSPRNFWNSSHHRVQIINTEAQQIGTPPCPLGFWHIFASYFCLSFGSFCNHCVTSGQHLTYHMMPEFIRISIYQRRSYV